jgi:hypothetical protein
MTCLPGAGLLAARESSIANTWILDVGREKVGTQKSCLKIWIAEKGFTGPDVESVPICSAEG